jgi:hypothetical protein
VTGVYREVLAHLLGIWPMLVPPTRTVPQLAGLAIMIICDDGLLGRRQRRAVRELVDNPRLSTVRFQQLHTLRVALVFHTRAALMLCDCGAPCFPALHLRMW